RLTVLPIPKGQEPARYPGQNRMPPALAKDWDDYFARFVAHYKLDETQKNLAEAKLQQAKHNLVVWLTNGEEMVTKTFPSGKVERKEDVAERIAEYRAEVKKLHEVYDQKLPKFQRDVEKKRLTTEKADIAKLRTELAAALDARTVEMKRLLQDVIDP